MKKFLVGIAAALLLFSATGCSLWPASKTAEITKVMLAAIQGDETIKAGDVDDIFTGEIEKVLFAVRLEGEGKHVVKVEFTQEDNKKPIKSKEKEADGTQDLTFQLAKPATGWRGGSYSVIAYLDNQKIGTKNFTIENTTETKALSDKKTEKTDETKKIKDAKTEVKTALDVEKIKIPNKDDFKKPKSNPAQISSSQTKIAIPSEVANTGTFVNAWMCTALNQDNSCQYTTDWYYDTATYFNASTQWKNLQAGDELWSVWYWEGYSGTGTYIGDAGLKMSNSGDGFVSFSLYNPDYWYTGNYWVEIYYKGSYFTTIPFAVYVQDFVPAVSYPASGYYDYYGNYILYNGSGYYDMWGNFWSRGTDWAYDDYVEDGYYDEYGNYILYDGTGYYDPYGYFWYWDEWYGDG